MSISGSTLAQPEPAADQQPDEPDGLGFFSGQYDRVPLTTPRLEFESFFWYASPGGDVGVEGSQLISTAALSIDDPRLGFGAEAHYHQGPWRVSLLGSLTSQHGGSVAQSPNSFDTLTVAPGDRLQTEIDLDTYGLRVGYRIWEFASDPDEHATPALSSNLEAVAGLRAYDYSLSIERTSGAGGRAEGDMLQLEPILGVKWSIEIDGKYALDLASNFGYIPEISGQSSSSFDITAGFRYSPVPMFAAQIGYRLLVYDLMSDDVEAEGALAGLYGGVTLSF